jgi:hypothetical protein
MLCGPRRHETLPSAIRNKVLACLATRFDVGKNVVSSVVKLDQPIVQYGKVARLEGGDLMVGVDLITQTDDTRDASFVRVSLVLLLYEQLLIFLSPVHSTYRSICSPTQKNPWIWSTTFLRSVETASCFGITNRTPIEVGQPDDGHPGSYSDCQSNIGQQHILLYGIWRSWSRWFDYDAICGRKNTRQRQVGYRWPVWHSASPSSLKFLLVQ